MQMGQRVQQVHYSSVQESHRMQENQKFQPYFEVLFLLYAVDSLRTLKVYYCLALVTFGCP